MIVKFLTPRGNSVSGCPMPEHRDDLDRYAAVMALSMLYDTTDQVEFGDSACTIRAGRDVGRVGAHEWIIVWHADNDFQIVTDRILAEMFTIVG